MTLKAAAKLRTLELYLDNQSVTVTAEKLGVSTHAVIDRLRSIGITLRPVGRTRVLVQHQNDPAMLAATIKGLRQQAAKDRAQKPKTTKPAKPNLTAQERLRTFELYLKHRDTMKVAAILGVDRSVVSMRLTRLGLKTPGNLKDVSLEQLNGIAKIAGIHQQLRQAAKGQTTWYQGPDSRRCTPAMMLHTLELFLVLQDSTKVAEALNIGRSAASRRIRLLGFKPRPPGGRQMHRPAFEEVNGLDKIEQVKRRLKKAVQSEQIRQAS